MYILLVVILVVLVGSIMAATISTRLRRPQPKGVELVDYPCWDTATTLVDQPIYGDPEKPMDWDDHYSNGGDYV